jgi:hypothetical protein
MPIGLIFTPRRSPARREANGYGVTTASNASCRAREPLIRPGSTPSRSKSGRRSKPHDGQRYPWHGNPQASDTGPPTDGTHILANHGSSARGANGRGGAARLGHMVHPPLKLLKYARAKSSSTPRSKTRNWDGFSDSTGRTGGKDCAWGIQHYCLNMFYKARM